MKKIFVILILFLLPQTVFANEFKFFVSHEARGILSDGNNAIITESSRNFPPSMARNLRLDFNPSYAYKVGIGASYGVFDVRFHYDKADAGNDSNEPIDYINSMGLFARGIPAGDPNHQIKGYNNRYDGRNVVGGDQAKWSVNVIDLEAGYTLPMDNFTVRFFGGLRYAKHKQASIVARFGECSEGAIVEDKWKPRDCEPNTESLIDFRGDKFYGDVRAKLQTIEGFGPRIGLSFHKPITDTSFSIIATVAWAPIFSERDLSDNIVQLITPGLIDWQNLEGIPLPDESLNQKGVNVVVHHLNLEAAFQYKLNLMQTMALVFDLGYRFDGHNGAFNSHSVSAQREAGPDSPLTQRQYGSRNDNLFNHGPFLRTTIRY